MKKGPKMFTPKDLAYIEDIFNWNITTSKKLDFYRNQITDNQMQKLFTEISHMHYEICQTLVKILESEEQNDR